MDWSRGWVEPEEKAGRLRAEVLTAGWKLAELALLGSEQGRCSKEVNFSSRKDGGRASHGGHGVQRQSTHGLPGVLQYD